MRVRLVPAAPASVVLLAALAAGPAAVPARGEPTVTCRGEVATLVGTDGPDTLTGTPGRDVVAGLAGDDSVTGLGGRDVLCGNGGADVVDAGRGADRTYAGPGDDQVADVATGSKDQALLGGRGDDALELGWRVLRDGEVVPVEFRTDFAAGVATVGVTGVDFPARSFRRVVARFSEGTWAVVGTAGPDDYRTDRYMAVDAATGPGRDVVHGSWHDDRINGGAGRDTAYADRGRDTCRSVERGPLQECEHAS